MEKYCEDCEYFEKGQERIQGMPSMCHSPENPGALVKRGEGAVECWAARSDEHKCGKAGKWFVRRHESVAEELESTPGQHTDKEVWPLFNNPVVQQLSQKVRANYLGGRFDNELKRLDEMLSLCEESTSKPSRQLADELEMTPGPYHSVDGVEYTYDKAAGAWRPTNAARTWGRTVFDYGDVFPEDKSKLFRHACNDAVYTFNKSIGVWVLYFPQNPNNEQYFYDTVRGRLWMYLASRDDWVELVPKAG